MQSCNGRCARARRRRAATFCGGAILALGLLVLAGTGCAATVGAEGAVIYGYPTVYAEIGPADLSVYPRVYYRGAYAYLIDGSWYYPTPRGWVIFREEPMELYRYRTRYLPPRYRAPTHRYPRERPRRYYPHRR
jgi:hypothetical protein